MSKVEEIEPGQCIASPPERLRNSFDNSKDRPRDLRDEINKRNDHHWRDDRREDRRRDDRNHFDRRGEDLRDEVRAELREKRAYSNDRRDYGRPNDIRNDDRRDYGRPVDRWRDKNDR